MTRVAAYVDGFNLYFGLKDTSGRRYLWLDLQSLTTSLLKPGQVLTQVTYFTAYVRNKPDSKRRQSAYVDALAAHSPLVTTVNGRFQAKDRRCFGCGDTWVVFERRRLTSTSPSRWLRTPCWTVTTQRSYSRRTAICARLFDR